MPGLKNISSSCQLMLCTFRYGIENLRFAHTFSAHFYEIEFVMDFIFPTYVRWERLDRLLAKMYLPEWHLIFFPPYITYLLLLLFIALYLIAFSGWMVEVMRGLGLFSPLKNNALVQLDWSHFWTDTRQAKRERFGCTQTSLTFQAPTWSITAITTTTPCKQKSLPPQLTPFKQETWPYVEMYNEHFKQLRPRRAQ